MNKEEIIKSETEELLGKLGVETEVEVAAEGEVFKIQIKTERDAPMLIGKYGETLAALKRILSAIVFQQCGEKIELTVNINDYRERQTEKLEKIAEAAAARVRADQQPATLRSFSAFERKIIHEYIARAHPDLASYSEGEGEERTLVIAIKKAETNS